MESFEKDMVKKLREEVSDLITPDFTDFDLLRWLKEHDYDFDYIVPNLRHHFRFIRCCDFSQYPKYFSIMDKYWPAGLLGLTGKDDNFVYIETLGRLDAEGVLKTVPKTVIILHRILVAEETVKIVRKYEDEVDRQSGLTCICDVQGSVVSPKTVSNLNGPYKHLVATILRHYKGMAQKTVVINMNPILSFVWNIAKLVFTRRMYEHLLVFGSNYKADLLQHVDANALPVHWGGNLVDENNDPKCRSKVVYCTPVPSNLYWRPSDEELKEAKGFLSLTVPARSFEFITFKVDGVNKHLEWSYYTSKDWGFGIFCTQDGDETDTEKMDMVFPQMDYINGHTTVIETGRIRCGKRGIYKVWFNNSFSWLTKLKVWYRIRLVDLEM